MSAKLTKIVITGTGRAGTTALMRLLTACGCYTGYEATDLGDPETGGGLEHILQGPDEGPHIVKAPAYYDKLPQLAEWYTIGAVIVPIRALSQASASRVAIGPGRAGGTWHASDQESQEAHNARVLYTIAHDCTRLGLPLVLIDFERMVSDAAYLYATLRPHVALPSLSDFSAHFAAVMDTGRVKRYPGAEGADK